MVYINKETQKVMKNIKSKSETRVVNMLLDIICKEDYPKAYKNLEQSVKSNS